MQPQRNQRRGQGIFTNNATFWILVGFVILVFLGGYYMGTHNEGKNTKILSATAHHAELHLRGELKTCNDNILRRNVELGLLTNETFTLQNENKRLTQRNQKLYAKHELNEKKHAECTSALEVQRMKQSEEDAAIAANVTAATQEVMQLRSQLNVLSDGRGARMLVTIEALKRVRFMNNQLRQMAGKPLDEVDRKHLNMSSSSDLAAKQLAEKEQALLEKWANNITNDTVLDIVVKQRSDKNLTAQWTPFVYNASIHRDIFFPYHSPDGLIERPTWQGALMKYRVSLSKKLFVSRKLTGSLSHSLLSLYDVAMCSLRRNDTNFSFSFPNELYWSRNFYNSSSLRRILDTPMVTLCSGCDLVVNTNLFRLACGSRVAVRHYGSYDFWLMRSRVRFTQAVYDAADDFMEKHGLIGNRYVALVHHVSTTHDKRCSPNSRRYLPHRLWMEYNYNKKPVHISQDTELQCAPGEGEIKQAISFATMGTIGIPSVYASLSPLEAKRVESYQLGNVAVLSVRSAFDEAVDIVIASRASTIVLSAYFEESQVVAEAFLLEKHFDIHYSDIMFF